MASRTVLRFDARGNWKKRGRRWAADGQVSD
jgi:hypothetical protein